MKAKFQGARIRRTWICSHCLTTARRALHEPPPLCPRGHGPMSVKR